MGYDWDPTLGSSLVEVILTALVGSNDGRLKESLSLTENHGEAETSFVLTHSS